MIEMKILALFFMSQLPESGVSQGECDGNAKNDIVMVSEGVKEIQGNHTNTNVGKNTTLEEVYFENLRREYDERSIQVDVSKFLDELKEAMPMQPPENQEEYNVLIAKIMTKSCEELFDFARYKGVLPQENLGEDIRLGNSEARLASLELSEDIQSVANYYANELFSKGILVRMNKLYANTLGMVFREEDGFTRSLTLVGVNDRQTIVFAAISDWSDVRIVLSAPKKNITPM